jgi:hypothetical protein
MSGGSGFDSHRQPFLVKVLIMGRGIDYTTPQGKAIAESNHIPFKTTLGGTPKIIILELYRRPDGTPGYPSDLPTVIKKIKDNF